MAGTLAAQRWRGHGPLRRSGRKTDHARRVSLPVTDPHGGADAAVARPRWAAVLRVASTEIIAWRLIMLRK